MNPLSVIELALSFSSNTCFGLMGTKWGEARSGKLGAASIAFGLVSLALGIFSQARAKQPLPSLTKADLEAANDRLRAQIANDRFNDEVINYMVPVQGAANKLQKAIDRALKDAKSHNPLDPELDALLNHDWAAYYEAFKDQTAGGYLQKCIDTTTFVTDHEEHKYTTLDLYMLAASTYLNLCQICLMIEWNAALADPNAEQTWLKANHKYHKALKAWKADHKKWLAEEASYNAYTYDPDNFERFGSGGGVSGFFSGVQHGGTLRAEPAPPDPPPPTPKMWRDLTTSVFATDIKDKVASFIDYADPIVTEMEKLQARRSSLDADLKGVLVANAPFVQTFISKNRLTAPDRGPQAFQSQVHNPATGEYWTPVPNLVAERQAKVLAGIELAGWMNDDQSKIKDLTKAQIGHYRGVVDNWKKTQTEYAFASS